MIILIQILFIFSIIGIMGGLLGIFYRNCLKVEGMIFHPLYIYILKPWMKSNNGFLRWISYPLGGCIYCATFWITLLLSIVFLLSTNPLLSWEYITLGIVLSSGLQHLVVCIACRWLIHNHPDF